MARREVKVVLGGDGGDELFGGYDRYYGNRYVDYYALLPRSVRRHVVPRLLRLMPEGFWYKSLTHKLRWLNQLSFAEGGRRHAQSLSYFYFTENFRRQLYGDELRATLEEFDPEAEICAYFESGNARDLVDKMLFADSMVRLPDHSVMILDRTTMAHGLEARAPFLDHKLAEFVARIPASFKVRGRTLRYIQARLAERYIPLPLLRRRKQGFSSPLPYLLADEFRHLFKAFLSNSQLVHHGYLRGEPIQRLLTEHLHRKVDHGNRLWLLCNAEIWYRMAIEGWSRGQVQEQLAGGESA
jgi:asparagine synthase (glutamine-hydrolysing)